MPFVIDKSTFLPHQRKWWDLPNYIRLLVGGYGSGKTYIAALRAIYLSRLNSGLPGQLVSPTYRIAKRSIIPTIQEMLDGAGISYKLHRTDSEFRIDNWDGHIWIGSGDEPDSLLGPNLAWAGIDEPFVMDKRVLDIILSRVRNPKAAHREIFMTGTPEELNWGYDLAMNDQGKYDIGVVLGSTRDNRYLPPEYLKTLLAGYSQEMIDAYIDGKFVNLLAGRVYKPFEREMHLAPRPDLPEMKLPIVAGIDQNVDYMSAEIAYRGPDWLHFFDEIRLSNSNTFDLAEVLKAKHPGIAVYPDPAGRARSSSSTTSDHAILRLAGFQVYAHTAHPSHRDRTNAVNRLFRLDKVSIEPEKCPHLVADLERNTWRSGSIDKRDLSMTHAGDGAGYLIEYLFPIRETKVEIVSRWGGRPGMTYREVQGMIRRRLHA